nr:hypothetical protein CFP56_13621 [Quercus suber]
MSPFKKSAVKGGSSKGKEHVIEIDDFSPRAKRAHSPSGVFNPNKFRSYAVFQTHENYFKKATPLIERVFDQHSLFDTNIPQWFARKDWNYLLSDLDDAYEDLVREFYANAIIEGDELKCWVRGKSFSVSPAYLAEILYINRPILGISPVYDDFHPDEELLKAALRDNLEFSSNGNSVSVSSLPPKLRVLTIIMFQQLVSPIQHRIDICAHIFHILRKIVLRTESRMCILFCCLILRILKRKGIYLSENEVPCAKPCPINMRTFNASIGHSKKGIKTKASATHSGSRSSSLPADEKLDSIVASVHELSSKMSNLTSILHYLNSRWDTKFTSIQTQLDEIQRKLEDNDD